MLRDPLKSLRWPLLLLLLCCEVSRAVRREEEVTGDAEYLQDLLEAEDIEADSLRHDEDVHPHAINSSGKTSAQVELRGEEPPTLHRSDIKRVVPADLQPLPGRALTSQRHLLKGEPVVMADVSPGSEPSSEASTSAEALDDESSTNTSSGGAPAQFDAASLLKSLPAAGDCGTIDKSWGAPAPYNFGLACRTGRCSCPYQAFYACATSNYFFPIEGEIGKVVAELGYCRLRLAVYVAPAVLLVLLGFCGVACVTRK
mmetsp:Transcript_5866/g.12870  ORF Transcript_5866/g.12870 Transcript_5866/m.12870 type:complete len:257 (+) Transcript_5866:122-892(+)